MIIKAGADVNTKNNSKNTALIFAILNGYKNIVKMLREQEAQSIELLKIN